MDINFYQELQILSFTDFRTETLLMIPFIITIVLLVLVPIIGFFSGYKRALFWSIGNWVFVLIGWGIFILAGDKMSMIISNFVAKMMEGQTPGVIISGTDILPTVKELFAPIFYLLVLFFGNAILLCIYYLFGKKILKIHNNKIYIDTAAKNVIAANSKSNFFKKHQIISKASGGFLFVLIGFPIIANVSQISYAVTSSYTTRDSASNSNSTISKMSLDLFTFGSFISKYNFTNYWQPIDKTVDATFSLVDMFNRGVYNDSFTIMGKFFGWIGERPVTDPINSVEETHLDEQIIMWNTLMTEQEVEIFSNSFAVQNTFQTFINIASHYDNGEKIDPTNFDFEKIKKNVVIFETWLIDNNKKLNKILVSSNSFDEIVATIKKIIFETENISEVTNEDLQRFVSALSNNFFKVV